MKKFSADMKVVRFGAEDVIVTSGAADMVFESTMGDGKKGNGTVIFDGSSYTMNGYGSVNNLLGEIRTKYNANTDDTMIDCRDAKHYLAYILSSEFTDNSGLGSRWNGFYTYDSNSNTFTKQ